jgi:hypothetical protein
MLSEILFITLNGHILWNGGYPIISANYMRLEGLMLISAFLSIYSKKAVLHSRMLKPSLLQVRPMKYGMALPAVFRINRRTPHIFQIDFPKALIIMGSRAFVAPVTICSIRLRMPIPRYFPVPNTMTITAILSEKALMGIKVAL